MRVCVSLCVCLCGCVSSDGNATAEDGAAWLAEMNAKMSVPGLAHWGVSKADASPSSELVDKSQVSTRPETAVIAVSF